MITPQNDSSLERKVLGSLMISKSSLEENLFSLSEDDFYTDKNRIIFNAIKKTFESNTPVDMVSISEHLSKFNQLNESGGISYINSIASSDYITSNTPTHIKVLKEKTLRRKMIAEGQRLIRAADDNSTDADKSILESIDSLSNSSEEDQDSSFSGAYEQLVKDVTEFKESGQDFLGLDTGYKDLSKIINGIRTNAFIGYVAWTSQGKSWDGLNIMANLIQQGKKVCFISLEQSKPQLLARLAGIIAGVDDEDIQMGTVPVNKKVDVKDAMDVVINSGCTIYLESDFDRIKKILFLEVKRNRPDIVFLDYIQNVKSKSAGNTNDKLEEVSRYFQQFCMVNDVPMWFASQMNKETHLNRDDGGTLGHKSCGQIGASSSVTIQKRVAHSKEEIAYRRNNNIPLESTWHVAKNRDGKGVDNIKMFFDAKTHKLYNYEQFDKEYGYGKYLSEVNSIPDEIKNAGLSQKEINRREFDNF